MKTGARARAVLPLQSFLMPAVTVLTMVAVTTVLCVVGYSIHWTILTYLAGLTGTVAAVGLGIDLHQKSIFATLAASLALAMAFTLVIALADQLAASMDHAREQSLTILLAIEIYIPFYLLMSLVGRWGAKSAARRAFDRGTSRFDPADEAAREDAKRRFRRQ